MKRDQLISNSSITLVFVDMNSKRPITCPEYLLKKLASGGC